VLVSTLVKRIADVCSKGLFMNSSTRIVGRRAVLGAMAVAAALAGFATWGSPAARAETPDDIKKKGSITFGIVTDQVPFGFINDKGENDGYDISLARMMAKELGVEPKFQPITSANRIPQLLTGKVDMLICALGMYPDRAKVVQYVQPYAAIEAVVYGPKDSTVSKPADLAGHTIAVEKGSSMDKALTESAPKDATIRRYDDASSAIQALLSGQTEYLGSYSHEFASVNKANPDRFAPKIVLSTEYEGIAVRPHQKELTDWVNDFMSRHEKDGTLNALYKKWFGTDFPKMPASMEGIPYSVQ
jgi:polar amino acid transport system substrate-binding protein